MGRRGKLTNVNQPVNKKGTALTDRVNIKFKIAIESQLDNKFCFKDLNKNGLKQFHRFIEETISKDLSIAEVDDLYKRKKGPKESITINNQEFELVHYGKDRKPERIFGYYNPENYFVLTRLDIGHKTHRT